MDNPSEINARHGDESLAAKQAAKNRWIGVAAVLIAAVAVVIVVAQSAIGPGPSAVRVATNPTAVETVAVPKTLPPVHEPAIVPPVGAQVPQADSNPPAQGGSPPAR